MVHCFKHFLANESATGNLNEKYLANQILGVNNLTAETEQTLQ